MSPVLIDKMTQQELNSRVRSVATVLALSGLLLHAIGAIVDWGQQPRGLSLALMVWSWLPYLTGLLLRFAIRNAVIPTVGLAGPLILDFLNYYSVYVASASSTAALGLLWAPFWNMVVVGPIGLLIGWGVSKTRMFMLPDSTSHA